MSPIGEHDSIGTDENHTAPADQRWRVTCNCGALSFGSNRDQAVLRHQHHFGIQQAKAAMDKSTGG